MRISRRTFLGGCAAAVSFRAAVTADRLGIMCQFDTAEASVRKVLDAAREAGFGRAQIQFPWDRADAAFLRLFPRWLASSGVRVDVLSAYVNCADPSNVLMNARAGDFDRAIEFAPAIGATRLVAWTGGFGKELMTADARNFTPAARDSIHRFLEPRLKKLEASRLTVALETYITLVCPDAAALRDLLNGLPPSITAVLDPPNLTPIVEYAHRDSALREMFSTLKGRTGVVHLKDFRLAKDGRSYELPGPLAGEMNYGLFLELIGRLPDSTPVIAEHIGPAEFAATHRKLLALL